MISGFFFCRPSNMQSLADRYCLCKQISRCLKNRDAEVIHLVVGFIDLENKR
jgi:hypothetical protein